MLLEIHPKNPQPRLIQRVVDCLNRDGIVIYPTDTCYGIGCSIFSKKAIEAIYKLKNYPKTKQLSIVCTDISDISRYAFISDLAYRNMHRLLPGPFTWVLPATKQVPKLLHSKRKEVGIRIPKNQICLELVRALGHPLLSAGAGDMDQDLSGGIPYYLHDHYGHQVDLVIDGGVLRDDHSTILRVDDDGIDIVRQGLGQVDFL